MAKLGMRHLRTDYRSWEDPLAGAEHGEVVYSLSRDQWAGAPSSSGSSHA